MAAAGGIPPLLPGARLPTLAPGAARSLVHAPQRFMVRSHRAMGLARAEGWEPTPFDTKIHRRWGLYKVLAPRNRAAESLTQQIARDSVFPLSCTAGSIGFAYGLGAALGAPMATAVAGFIIGPSLLFAGTIHFFMRDVELKRQESNAFYWALHYHGENIPQKAEQHANMRPAIAAYDRMASALRTLGEYEHEVDTYVARGQALLQIGRPHQAVQTLGYALFYQTGINKKAHGADMQRGRNYAARIKQALGLALLRTGDLDGAIEAWSTLSNTDLNLSVHSRAADHLDTVRQRFAALRTESGIPTLESLPEPLHTNLQQFHHYNAIADAQSRGEIVQIILVQARALGAESQVVQYISAHLRTPEVSHSDHVVGAQTGRDLEERRAIMHAEERAQADIVAKMARGEARFFDDILPRTFVDRGLRIAQQRFFFDQAQRANKQLEGLRRVLHRQRSELDPTDLRYDEKRTEIRYQYGRIALMHAYSWLFHFKYKGAHHLAQSAYHALRETPFANEAAQAESLMAVIAARKADSGNGEAGDITNPAHAAMEHHLGSRFQAMATQFLIHTNVGAARQALSQSSIAYGRAGDTDAQRRVDLQLIELINMRVEYDAVSYDTVPLLNAMDEGGSTVRNHEEGLPTQELIGISDDVLESGDPY
jgi:tetratricopeptide (TPR) repeat protein